MPHFDADQWSVLPITVIFGAARLIVAVFAVRPLVSQLWVKRATLTAPVTSGFPLILLPVSEVADQPNTVGDVRDRQQDRLGAAVTDG